VEQIQLKGKCRGGQHRVIIHIKNQRLHVECPDHDFDLDEVEQAFGAAPRERNYCSGIFYAWHGVSGIALEQVYACLCSARTHGLTSKTAKHLFGADISNLLYNGVRSIDFANELVQARVYPTRAPFDPAASESFTTKYRRSLRGSFAELAIAGGIKLDATDVAWIIEKKLALGYVLKNINYPDMWETLDPSLDRDKLNNWWRVLRKNYPEVSGEIILNFVNIFPTHLKGIEFVPINVIEYILLNNKPRQFKAIYRVIMDFNINDLPSILVVWKRNWTITDLNDTPESVIIDTIEKERELLVSRLLARGQP